MTVITEYLSASLVTWYYVRYRKHTRWMKLRRTILLILHFATILSSSCCASMMDLDVHIGNVLGGGDCQQE